MKKITLLFSLIAFTLFAHAQVAISTTGANPNASAMLDISSGNKGLLIPRVSLINTIDNTTVPNPATSLLVYNTNAAALKGAGFYYNSGTPASPNWQAMQDLVLPFTKATNSIGTAFTIENYSGNGSSVAVKGNAGGGGIGVEGTAVSGTGVSAKSFSGHALMVDGKIRIAGNGQSPAAGKVLTSDLVGNATWEGAIAFSAKGVVNTGSHVIAKATNTKLRFASVKYDLSGDYDGPNAANHSVFTVPVHGIYHFDIQVEWVTNFNADGFTKIELIGIKNGVQRLLVTHLENSTGDAYAVANANIDVELQVGEQVFVQVYQNIDDYLNLGYSEPATYFNGRMVIKL